MNDEAARLRAALERILATTNAVPLGDRDATIEAMGAIRATAHYALTRNWELPPRTGAESTLASTS